MNSNDLNILAAKIAEYLTAQPRWLGVKQAVVYARLGKEKLKKLAKEGKIKGYADPESKRGDWIFDRKSIDQYRLSPLEFSTAKEKEILAKFKGLF